MDIPDWTAALANCVRSLASGGTLLITLTHPCFEDVDGEFATQGRIAVRQYLDNYSIPQSIGYRIHRPLSHYVNAALRLGCVLDEMIEPQLPADFGAIKDVTIPSYMILAFHKTGSSA